MPATVAELTNIPLPDPTSVRTPSAALITVRGSKTYPTCIDASSAPANPTEITRAGFTSRITASVARRAASAPIPPHTRVASPFSNSRYRRPPCSRVLTLVLTLVLAFQLRISGATSRSIAAMMAILDINARHTRCPGTSPPSGARLHRLEPSASPVPVPPSLNSQTSSSVPCAQRHMRTASIVARGSRPSNRPVTISSTTPVANANT